MNFERFSIRLSTHRTYVISLAEGNYKGEISFGLREMSE